MKNNGFALVALMVAFLVIFSAVAIVRVTALPIGKEQPPQTANQPTKQDVSSKDQTFIDLQALEEPVDEETELADISKEEGENFSFIE